ncbi:MAG TPA: hypothetical protein VF258_07905 [Luteolibacter sp.]
MSIHLTTAQGADMAAKVLTILAGLAIWSANSAAGVRRYLGRMLYRLGRRGEVLRCANALDIPLWGMVGSSNRLP